MVVDFGDLITKIYQSPKKCGFRNGSWQMDMIIEAIQREFGVAVKA